ncbi:hypothetical protein MUY27_10850 [Mucilaginibacter sp. RS28]|uniref:Uncharacterized protein n=1 Tax=Mucilaginibacter straminoryzae TaxID=2932774 RepID=A0A9X2B9X5_9SPHI|nr:hypothetical protein [Mucilaginibacter straminoryzae]MCJ8210210.1 hypothetical protein [Mucilaginibacter straminoryzae]
MEFQDQEDYNNQQEDNYVEIYSRRAIFWFSLIFTPIFGGIMMMLNLRWSGYKTPAWIVLLFSFAYYLLENLLLKSYLPSVVDFQKVTPQNATTLLGIMLAANLIGALVLIFYFYRKYFPEKDYYPRSIAGPLLVAFLLFILQLFLVGGAGR